MIIYEGMNRHDVKLNTAVNIANNLLGSDIHFYNEIERFGTFDMSNCTSKVVARELKTTHRIFTIKLKTYKPWWRWSKARARYKRSTPHVIYLNYYRLNRSVESIVGSLVHEIVHMADNFSDKSFGHGNNSPKGKDKTAPYWIGTLAKKMAKR